MKSIKLYLEEEVIHTVRSQKVGFEPTTIESNSDEFLLSVTVMSDLDNFVAALNQHQPKIILLKTKTQMMFKNLCWWWSVEKKTTQFVSLSNHFLSQLLKKTHLRVCVGGRGDRRRRMQNPYLGTRGSGAGAGVGEKLEIKTRSCPLSNPPPNVLISTISLSFSHMPLSLSPSLSLSLSFHLPPSVAHMISILQSRC